MKKSVLLVLLLIFMLCASVFMTACGGGDSSEPAGTDNATEAEESAEENAEEEQAEEPVAEEPAYSNVEEYLTANPDMKTTMENAAAQNNMTLGYNGNEIIYYYDLSQRDDYTEEYAKSDEVKEGFKAAFEEQKATFGNSTRDLEKAFGISGIITTITYTWEGEEILSRSFTSADAE